METSRPRLRFVVGFVLLSAGCSAEETVEKAAGKLADMTLASRSVSVTDAYLAEPAAGERAALYLTIENPTREADELIGISTAVAGRVEIHRNVLDTGRVTMEPVEGVVIPAGWTVHMAPGSLHIMLFDLKAPIRAGDSVDLTLEFRSGETVSVDAQVATYAELEELLVVEE